MMSHLLLSNSCQAPENGLDFFPDKIIEKLKAGNLALRILYNHIKMGRHMCVEIRGEMVRIRDNGNTVFDCTPTEAFSELVQAQKEGKTYYTGSDCDNTTKEGRCAGHVTKS